MSKVGKEIASCFHSKLFLQQLTFWLLHFGLISNASGTSKGQMSPAESYLDSLEERNFCSFHRKPDSPDEAVQQGSEGISYQSENVTIIECSGRNRYCQAVWRFDPVEDPNGVAEVILQGCWIGNSHDCEEESCIAYTNLTSVKLANSTHLRWCCCLGSMCNAVFNYTYDPIKSHRQSVSPEIVLYSYKPAKSPDQGVSPVMLTVSFLIALGILVGLLIFHQCWLFARRKRNSQKSPSAANSSASAKLLPTPSSTDCESGVKGHSALQQEKCGMFRTDMDSLMDFKSIDLIDLLNTGRYGTVYRGALKSTGENVAVKVYKIENHEYFVTESSVYGLPYLEHENLLKCFGAKQIQPNRDMEEEGDEGEVDNMCMANMFPEMPEYWLVMEYMPGGSLHDFLKTNIVDWEGFVSMGYGIADGLAFLHSQIRFQDGGYKPGIAHRDINSRNVLLKPDGKCVICDLGFSIILEEEYLRSASSGDFDDGVSLPEVGTVRYMAPEVLEGAVNLRDPESALKQVDVYSFGLVLWEIASRCEELYKLTGSSVPEYSPPYSREICQHPTLEDMQCYVCRKKVRPLFPPAVYKFYHPILRSLREVIEDCWDQDAEARITALCARERISEMKPIKGFPMRIQNQISGKVRNMDFPDLQLAPLPCLNENTAGVSNTVSAGYGSLVEGGTTNGCGTYGPAVTSGGSSRPHSYLLDMIEQRPPNKVVVKAPGNSGSPDIPVQPYQGRNPCQERNVLGFLHQQDSSEDSSNGKNSKKLVESEFKNKVDPCSPETLTRFLIGGKEKLINQQRDKDNAKRKAEIERQQQEEEEERIESCDRCIKENRNSGDMGVQSEQESITPSSLTESLESRVSSSRSSTTSCEGETVRGRRDNQRRKSASQVLLDTTVLEVGQGSTSQDRPASLAV